MLSPEISVTLEAVQTKLGVFLGWNGTYLTLSSSSGNWVPQPAPTGICSRAPMLLQHTVGTDPKVRVVARDVKELKFCHIFQFCLILVSAASNQRCHSHTLQYYSSCPTTTYHPHIPSLFPHEVGRVQRMGQNGSKWPLWPLRLRKLAIWISTSKANEIHPRVPCNSTTHMQSMIIITSLLVYSWLQTKVHKNGIQGTFVQGWERERFKLINNVHTWQCSLISPCKA